VAPDYAEAQNSLGIVLLEKRCLDDAISHISRALELRPNFAGAHANLGNAYQEQGELERAVESYRTALTLDPRHREAAFRLASAHLTRDEPQDALAACDICLAIDPHCQHGLAYKAMALQALGREEEARELYDYERMIRPAHLKPPARFANLDEFNEVLAKAVREHPTLVWEPFNRVTRGGAVSGDLLLDPTPTIKLFERALRGAIDEYKDSLSEIPGHPLQGRIPRNYRLTLIASILKGGGRHPAHIHESAWLSGVYYVKVPEVVSEEDSARAGWLEFGRPDYPAPAGFDPVTIAKPARAGLARFFPSYFFHGTIPFEGSEERIGIAFDAYPED
jgi:tetratricopeptide (TPR) repeat protein